MKKQLIAIAVASAAIATSSIASANDGWFIGGQLAKSKLDFSTDNSYAGQIENYALGKVDSPLQVGFRGGKYINDNTRIYASLNYGYDDAKEFGVKEELTNYSALFSADYLFGQGPVKPFVGASVGGQLVNVDLSGYGVSGDDNASGFLYGAQAGAVWNVNDSWNVEAGYQYLLSSTEYTLYGAKMEVDNIQNVYLSVDYLF